MLTILDRLTIYALLCFISFCALVLKTSGEPTLMPLIGLSASIVAMWIEMRQWPDVVDENNS
ncbi:hypothetical protein [Vibrio methylphosphonaticus]|uniref:hypothetical protein n=1 Tax=Vibrio methylphosphonaticus TaxID=2946866 RepID=UPI00202A5AD5|nr:hypothetical protein [Vibrio methylphosphonaticus]MCL9777032.1 hypothetical protein [Vibrio methylphosphonaticus]